MGGHSAFGKEMSDRVKTQFLEIVFSMKKSYSIMIVMMLKIRPELLQECIAIVQDVAKDIDLLSAVRDRRNGREETRLSNGMAAPVFGEISNRLLEPAVHFHLIVPNVTHDPARDIMLAMDYRYIYENVGRLAEAFDSRVEAWISGLGFELRDGEIACIPPEVIARFSSRKQQIDSNMERFRREFEEARQKKCPGKPEKSLQFEIGALDTHGNPTWNIDERRLRTYASIFDRPAKAACDEIAVYDGLLTELTKMGHANLQDTVAAVLNGEPRSRSTQVNDVTDPDDEAASPQPEVSLSEYEEPYFLRELLDRTQPEAIPALGSESEVNLAPVATPSKEPTIPLPERWPAARSVPPVNNNSAQAEEEKKREKEARELKTFQNFLVFTFEGNHRTKIDGIKKLKANAKKKANYERLIQLSKDRWNAGNMDQDALKRRDEFESLWYAKDYTSFLARAQQEIRFRLRQFRDTLTQQFLRALKGSNDDW